MFPPKVRLALVLLCVGVGIYAFVQGQLFPGVAFFVVGGLLVYGHISYNRIWLVYKHVLSADYEVAETELKKINDISSLSQEQLAYYHFCKGMIEMHKTAYEEAEAALLHALDLGLKTDNDMAVANYSLARIYYTQTSYQIAREYLDKAKLFKVHPNFDVHVKQLDRLLRQERPDQN